MLAYNYSTCTIKVIKKKGLYSSNNKLLQKFAQTLLYLEWLINTVGYNWIQLDTYFLHIGVLFECLDKFFSNITGS